MADERPVADTVSSEPRRQRATLQSRPQEQHRRTRLDSITAVIRLFPEGTRLTGSQFLLLMPLVGPNLGYASIKAINTDLRSIGYQEQALQGRLRIARPTRSEISTRKPGLEAMLNAGGHTTRTVRRTAEEFQLPEHVVRRALADLIASDGISRSFLPERPDPIDSLSEILHALSNNSTEQESNIEDLPEGAIDIRTLFRDLSQEQIRRVLIEIGNLRAQSMPNMDIQARIVAFVNSLKT